MKLFRTIMKDRNLKPMLSFVLFVLVLVLLYLIYDRTLREGGRWLTRKAPRSTARAADFGPDSVYAPNNVHTRPLSENELAIKRHITEIIERNPKGLGLWSGREPRTVTRPSIRGRTTGKSVPYNLDTMATMADRPAFEAAAAARAQAAAAAPAGAAAAAGGPTIRGRVERRREASLTAQGTPPDQPITGAIYVGGSSRTFPTAQALPRPPAPALPRPPAPALPPPPHITGGNRNVERFPNPLYGGPDNQAGLPSTGPN